MVRPLDNVRVIGLTQVLSGPFCTHCRWRHIPVDWFEWENDHLTPVPWPMSTTP